MEQSERKRSGVLHDVDLQFIMDHVLDVLGDFAEIGVFRGNLFTRLVGFAYKYGRKAWAFDSFAGMDDPSIRDMNDDGDTRYPKGALSNSLQCFHKTLNGLPYPKGYYRICDGFIPACFDKVPEETRFAFAYVDVDQYAPTKQSIDWVFDRVVFGGVIGFDDYFECKKSLAAGAINEFIAERKGDIELLLRTDNHQIFFTKKEATP